MIVQSCQMILDRGYDYKSAVHTLFDNSRQLPRRAIDARVSYSLHVPLVAGARLNQIT